MRFVCAFAVVAAAFGQGVPARMVVTAEGSHSKPAPVVNRADVVVRQGKDQAPVTDWQPANSGLQLLVMIDDGADSDLGLQLEDLRKFMRAQPASTEIGVDYMRNGTVISAHAFTSDHDAAARSLRLPLGIPGVVASPYVALSERIKKWPAYGGRREALMVTSGIDGLYPGGDIQNPYLNRAIEDAQKAGILVHSIYYAGAGHAGHSYYQTNWGQSYLSRLADETGGEAYWQGFQSPVSFAPYLDELEARLEHQYLMTFEAKPEGKSGLQPVKVRTEKAGVDLAAASRVWVPVRQ
ncbi:MAG: hypothetical protein M3Z09_02110 [Acidobacteriota bacterium]|nr:hypothetical protein [Acidobacteriota bacterium]